MLWLSIPLLLLALGGHELAEAFTVGGQVRFSSRSASHLTAEVNGVGKAPNPVDTLSDERKENLFRHLLRDLEVEGVPVLGCDVDQVYSMQAALWTIMAELCENKEEQKACLVMESIPVDDLRKFADHFDRLKTQPRVVDFLPELKRFNVSLIGKGVGPGLLIETANTTLELLDHSILPNPSLEFKWQAAMKSFLSRMTASVEADKSGEGVVVNPEQSLYHMVDPSSAFDSLATFWNCICQLQASRDDELTSVVLCSPPVSARDTSHGRFSALSEAISGTLCSSELDGHYSIQHMHPFYDRDEIHPSDELAHGHVPPTGWLRAVLTAYGMGDRADSLTDNELALQNYLRRSPLPAVVIQRLTSDTTTTDGNSSVQLSLENGKTKDISGLEPHARNVIRMTDQGYQALQKGLDGDIVLTM